MLSPFPGMDPFIENDSWSDFHASMIVTIKRILVPSLRPRYVVLAEERVYLEQAPEDTRSRVIVPDIAIADKLPVVKPSRGGIATAVAIKPLAITLPEPLRVKEHYLTIRKHDSYKVVTVIELLSPTNKRAPGHDPSNYLVKRDEVLLSDAHLVELDLLRGGRRLPSIEPLPLADFFAIISRNDEWPRATAYPWTLHQPMPTVPIPLSEGDADVMLDLQSAFTTVYDEGGYDYTLNYERHLEPVLSPEDEEWVAEVLKSRTNTAT